MCVLFRKVPVLQPPPHRFVFSSVLSGPVWNTTTLQKEFSAIFFFPAANYKIRSVDVFWPDQVTAKCFSIRKWQIRKRPFQTGLGSSLLNCRLAV